MRHRLLSPIALLLSALLLSALLASAVWAAPSVEVTPSKEGARLLVGGRLITIFRKPNAGLSPDERADVAAERLTALIRDGLRPADIEIRLRQDGSWGVYARGGLLMIATAEEAEARQEEPKVTAQRWAQNLKAALGDSTTSARKPSRPAPRVARAPRRAPTKQPTLAAANSSVAVPVGETRTVALRGTATGAIEVAVEGESVRAEVAPDKAAVRVRGLVPGRATVRVRRQGQEAAFDVWVKKYAGQVLEVGRAEVTGSTTPAALVRRVAREHLLDGVDQEPGAVVRVAGEPEGVRALGRGESTEVAFPITITGEGYLPVRTTARVRVRNVPLPPQDAKVLLYSNDPESVREHGTLFEGAFESDGPARLFYHHQNRMGRPFLFQIHLLNPNDEPADVQIIQADAGPTLNTIQVGHRAVALYLAAWREDIGYIARVPARGARLLFSRSLPNGLTASGIYQLRTLRGGPLVVRISAAEELLRPEAEPALLATARATSEIYPSPQKQETYAYTCGGNWTFIPLGRKPIARGDRKLHGNYGVLYDVRVQVENPTDEARTVQVVMSAEAGWARGAFIINGQLVEAPHLAPPGEAILYTLRLQPQERKVLSIQSIPAGGGFYPISIIVRS